MTSSASTLITAIFFILIYLILIVLYFTAFWKIYKKAGQPGWGFLVPFYNIYLHMKIVRRPLWWIVFFFIPVANIIVAVILIFDMAKVFGKGKLFAFFLLLILPFIGYPILAFGKAQYIGSNNMSPTSQPPTPPQTQPLSTQSTQPVQTPLPQTPQNPPATT